MESKEMICIFCKKLIKRCKCKPRPNVIYQGENMRIWRKKLKCTIL